MPNRVEPPDAAAAARTARRAIAASSLMVALLLPSWGAAAGGAAGRWSGVVDVPGTPVQLSVDLAQDAKGAWIGSVSFVEWHLHGAALDEIVVGDGKASFAIAQALADPTAGKAAFDARIEGGEMRGEFRQAGHQAPFQLRHVGPAQVEVPPLGTPVPKALEGEWAGEFIGIGGYPRQVTITLSNHAGQPATAQYVVVGKQTTNVPVDLVTFAEDALRVQSSATGVHFEGRYRQAEGEIRGAFELGPYEFPLTLKRRPGAKP